MVVAMTATMIIRWKGGKMTMKKVVGTVTLVAKEEEEEKWIEIMK